jgi:hypothetical protein
LDSVPSPARSRLIGDAFADFPSAPGVRLDVLRDDGSAAGAASEAPGLAAVALSGMDAAISTDGTSLQIVGSTSTTKGVVSLSIKHTPTCKDIQSVKIQVLDKGVAIDLVEESGAQHELAWVAKPWAVDATGRELRTWFEAEGSVLRQYVDTEGAEGPITFDPTYSFVNCFSGHFSDISAFWYLNMNADDADYCPVMGMFMARNGYRPVFGFETNVANDYGKIILRQDGGCTDSPDTGPSWDFQVPCKAHDYCYDLRKAGFSGTVSDSDCDGWFFWLMEAHCNDRVLADQCRSVRDSYFAAVSAPGVVTNPDPAAVPISNFNSAQCLDVEGSSMLEGARVLQYWCNFTPNQLWKITPVDGHPGRFRLVAQHSQKCADTWQRGITQWSCQYDEQIVQIRGAFNLNEYTIRPEVTNYTTCFDVPWSSTTPGEQIITYSCNETSNQIWFIN